MLDDRGADHLVGDDHDAVRFATPHLGPVRGQPGDMLAFLHGGFRQELTGEKRSLSAES